MSEFDLWADENEPEAQLAHRTYCLRIKNTSHPKGNFTSVWVSVEPYGMIDVEKHSFFLGKQLSKMEWEERMEVYSWLIEWEYAAWRRIGPEDSELFATRKLDEEYGID